MTQRQQWGLLGSLAVVYLIGLGVLAGVISERIRFDTVRARSLRRLEDATARARAGAMEREKELQTTAPSATLVTDIGAGGARWRVYVQTIDAALKAGDVSTAERAWREAYGAALRTRAWRPLVEVGDAAVRIGALDGRRSMHVGRARELYLAALIRARADRSAEGAIRVAESFHALGDPDLVEHCLVIAESLGAGADNPSIVRLRALSRRALDMSLTPRLEP
jgi:hypothetical protein